MKYIIGFDCGATKSECALADSKGNILRKEKGKSANFLVIGADKASDNILSLIKKCQSKIKSPNSEIETLVIGAAGAGRNDDASKLKKVLTKKLKKQKINFKSLIICGDHEIALKAAFPNSSGCIIIAGTGSNICGKDLEGNIHRVGGFGRQIGDEGSGYSIGREGLQAASKYLDGRSEKTKIAELLYKEYKIDSPEKLISKVHKKNFDIASISKIVLQAAVKKDKIAFKILDEESEELLRHIKAILKKMKMNNLDISFAGSLLTNKNVYSNMLRQKIKTSLPSVKIIKPKYSPVEGAILIAKEMLSD